MMGWKKFGYLPSRRPTVLMSSEGRKITDVRSSLVMSFLQGGLKA
jgi:hypothetical protein